MASASLDGGALSKTLDAPKAIADIEKADKLETLLKPSMEQDKDTPKIEKQKSKSAAAPEKKKSGRKAKVVNDGKESGGRWSKDEDALLRFAVLESGPRNWKKISGSYFNGSRSDVQCLHRWQKVLRPGLVKGPWTKEEDDQIVYCVQHGITKWSEIALHISGRIGKQCRERWFNHLDPKIKREPWTDEEDKILVDAQRKLGNKWSKIAKLLPGRPENAVKNRWNSSVRRKTTGGTKRPRSAKSKILASLRTGPKTVALAAKVKKAKAASKRSKASAKAQKRDKKQVDTDAANAMALFSMRPVVSPVNSNKESNVPPKKRKRGRPRKVPLDGKVGSRSTIIKIKKPAPKHPRVRRLSSVGSSSSAADSPRTRAANAVCMLGLSENELVLA